MAVDISAAVGRGGSGGPAVVCGIDDGGPGKFDPDEEGGLNTACLCWKI